jgi:succinate dehydrogenase/fumarate reductase flavoprotein subunit
LFNIFANKLNNKKSISNNLNAIVVGSGIAGIASAIRLQQKGFNVIL